jgi:hypothetical protein
VGVNKQANKFKTPRNKVAVAPRVSSQAAPSQLMCQVKEERRKKANQLPQFHLLLISHGVGITKL